MPRDDLEEIKKCLVMWGDWSRDINLPKLGYPTKTNFVIVPCGTSVVYDEDVAELVEQCMNELRDRNQSWYESLYYYYYWQLPIFEVAKKLKLSKSSYKIEKQKAESWLDALYFYKINKKIA